MKLKKIGTKLLAIILPVVLLAMVVLTLISTNYSKSTINEQISSKMQSELKAQMGEIDEYLNNIKSTTTTLSGTVSSTYKTATMSEYESVLESILKGNPLILGAGIWFEPYVYNADEKFQGLYVNIASDENGNDIFESKIFDDATYALDSVTYDYTTYPTYPAAQSATSAEIMKPYFDEFSKSMLTECTMPIFEGSTFIRRY